MKVWIKKNWFRLFIAFCALLLVLAVVYGLVIVPAQERSKKESDASFRSIMRNACLADADTEYYSLQKLNGTENKDRDGIVSYSVTASTRTWIEGRVKDMKDECYRKYPY